MMMGQIITGTISSLMVKHQRQSTARNIPLLKKVRCWAAKNNAECIHNTDGDSFKEGDYSFGDEDDNAMTVGSTSRIMVKNQS